MLKAIKIPHVFALLTLVILAVSLLSYVIPFGFYEREEVQVRNLTRTVVIPASFQTIPTTIHSKVFLLANK